MYKDVQHCQNPSNVAILRAMYENDCPTIGTTYYKNDFI